MIIYVTVNPVAAIAVTVGAGELASAMLEQHKLVENPHSQYMLAQEVLDSGNFNTYSTETLISGAHSLLYLNPSDGATVLYHLPVYASVGINKRFRFKNRGQGIARIDCFDGKLIDGEAYLELMPADRCLIAKDDTANWQTT